LATFRQESTIATWLLGIAKYKCAQLFRKQRRRQMISTHYVNEICYQIYADRTRSIEDKLLYEEQWKNLIYGLSKIRQADQWVLNLRFFQNLSIIELAEVLGKSKAAAHKQLSRALGRLRNITNVGMAGYN